jgi:RNA polymerase sigma factor (sigma-70 family)
LRAYYASAADESLPQRFVALIAAFEDRVTTQGGGDALAFQGALLAVLPDLRRFARSIDADPHRADDLVQDAVLEALQRQHRFQQGADLRAWVITLLRNQASRDRHKAKHETDDPDGKAAGQLVSPPDQFDRVALQDVWKSLAQLPSRQRDALILVGASGMSYGEAAAILGCETGTVKSRVSRARALLSDTIGVMPRDPRSSA